jgi:hypothetical protein
VAIVGVLAGRKRRVDQCRRQQKKVVFYTAVLLHPPDEICHVKLELYCHRILRTAVLEFFFPEAGVMNIQVKVMNRS